MTRPSHPTESGKPGLHPRNRHRSGYAFEALARACPELAPFVHPSPTGTPTIDFGDPEAVLTLNRALLLADYGLASWDLPAGYLCPPIPGRADYLHCLADLLAGDGPIPHGPSVRILDIGVGANLVYPIVGRADYGWSFVGTDIDADALAWAGKLVRANPLLRGTVELRRQASPRAVFAGVTKAREHFAACLCNPPFHASSAEAQDGTLRKLRNLAGRTLRRDAQATLNFGGRANELVCPGGERGFATRMIAESAQVPDLCGWFTCLVSKSENLPALEHAASRAGAAEHRVIPMVQGQKRSRILAWRFSTPPEA